MLDSLKQIKQPQSESGLNHGSNAVILLQVAVISWSNLPVTVFSLATSIRRCQLEIAMLLSTFV